MLIRNAYLAAWAMVAALLVACEVISIVSRRAFTGIHGLMERIVGRQLWWILLLFLGWMWLGWHFFAR